MVPGAAHRMSGMAEVRLELHSRCCDSEEGLKVQSIHYFGLGVDLKEQYTRCFGLVEVRQEHRRSLDSDIDAMVAALVAHHRGCIEAS